MTSAQSLISAILFLIAALYAGLGLIAWRHRPALAVNSFSWLMLGIAIWSLFYAIEWLIVSLLSAADD